MRAEIICVGTELLLGDIVNTNAQFIAQQLSALGISVYNQQVVGDNPERLYQAAEIAKIRSDIVIFTGGLGPTEDDLTKQTVASLYNDTLVFNQKICDDIEDYFIRIGRVMTENNRRQAYVPARGKYLENNYGTAPGIVFIDGEKLAILMPGVPREMKPMMTKQVVPMLSKLVRGAIVSRYVHVIGIGESALEEKISILLDSENPTMALYAKEGEVTVRLTALAVDKNTANEMLDRLYEKLDSLIHNNIYGVDVDNIETVLVNQLKSKGKTVATAESCTGGGLSARITSVPGASEVFSLGVCTYSDEQKHKILGVDEDDLSTYTAVSAPVAIQMAQGILKKADADYAIATTGYAGPGGGTPQEPVGTVYIALATKELTYVKKFSYSGDRERITHLACQSGLDMLRCVMNGIGIEGARIVDVETDTGYEDENEEKGGFLKGFMTMVLLVLLSAALAGGYLWYKNGGNDKINLPKIDINISRITETITDTIDKIMKKEPETVAKVLADRRSEDFFQQGFEKATLKTVNSLHSQNRNLEGWLTFRYSHKEYPVYSDKNATGESTDAYFISGGAISDYTYISGFTGENFINLTDLETVRDNAGFILFDTEGHTDYQIFSVATFSQEDFEKLVNTADKQEYIVAVRARSLFDVDVMVKDSDKMLVLVQNLGDDRYIAAFAVKGSRSVFPSVDIKSMTLYSDWYMEEKKLSDEMAAEAILYAQEVYDRDNWLYVPVVVETPSPEKDEDKEKEEIREPSASPSPQRTATPVPTAEPTRTPKPTASPKPTATPKPTVTPQPTVTVTPTARPQATPKPESTSAPKPEPTPVRTENPQAVQTPVPQPTAEPTAEPETKPTAKPESTPKPTEKPTPAPTPEGEILTVTMNGQVVSGPARQILSQIVAIEMTSSWNPEALKAQAVAAHTYLKYQYSNGVTAPSVAGRTNPSSKVTDAVSQVADLIMTVGGRAVYTPYCASMAGRSNPASQVWGTAHSHLVSVESKYDYLSSGYEKTYTIPAEEMKEILDDRIGTELDLEEAEDWFEIVDYTDGGYVRRMTVDGQKTYVSQSGNTRNITGNWFATDILADAGRPLRSAAFTISYDDGNFIIVTKGYGHGVGMSQWGAQLYAQHEGWNYEKILKHYYTGVTIQSVK